MAKKVTTKTASSTHISTAILLITGVLSYEWLHSAYSKFQPGFIEGMPKTIGFFSLKNPHQFYVDFLKNADPQTLGNLTRFAELAVGAGLAIAALALLFKFGPRKVLLAIATLAALGGAFLNLNFYLAAGHTSPSTEGINVVMGLIQLILLAYFFKLANKA